MARYIAHSDKGTLYKTVLIKGYISKYRNIIKECGEKPGVRQRSYLQWWSQSHPRLSNPRWRERQVSYLRDSPRARRCGDKKSVTPMRIEIRIQLRPFRKVWYRRIMTENWMRIVMQVIASQVPQPTEGRGTWLGKSSPGRDRFDARYGCRRVEAGVESWVAWTYFSCKAPILIYLLPVLTHLLTFCVNSSTYFSCKLIYFLFVKNHESWFYTFCPDVYVAVVNSLLG